MADPIHLTPPQSGPVDLLIVAGEHSGDQHAAALVQDMHNQHPDWKIAAVGGPALKAAGAQLLYDLTAMSVVGLVEVLRHYSLFSELFKCVVDWVREHQPRGIMLVDYPGFNLRLAAALKKAGISRKGGGNVFIYQYVSPQIWAWKAGRRFKMAEMLDELGVIFPFEVECYADTDLPVRFVGHPFAQAEHCNPLSYAADGPLLLLPGSRMQAVRRIFPPMLEVLKMAQLTGEPFTGRVLYPDEGVKNILESLIAASGIRNELIDVSPVGPATGSAVLTSSGTMSLNCALAGIPGAVVYRANPLTYLIGRRLVGVQWLGIANLILKREVYPEFIQAAVQPKRLLNEIRRARSDIAMVQAFAESARELHLALQDDGASTVISRIEFLMESR